MTLDGGDRVNAAGIVLATGVRDVLPDIPGLDALWGTVVAHCPFCHGHELSGGAVAVQGGPSAARAALMLSRIADRVLVIADGFEVDEFGRTSLPNVYAAGDLAHLPGLPMPLASVLSAAAAGLVAAAACVHDPVLAELSTWCPVNSPPGHEPGVLTLHLPG